jgi:hypothetical protein
MPLITIIFFFIFVAMLFMLNNVFAMHKKFKAAEKFGIDNFDIDLPTGATIKRTKLGASLPAFKDASDAEGFFMLITPYIGSLNKIKREYLHQHMNDLKNDLKMHKGVYQYFMDEYKIYDGLDDTEAAEKWAGKS